MVPTFELPGVKTGVREDWGTLSWCPRAQGKGGVIWMWVTGEHQVWFLYDVGNEPLIVVAVFLCEFKNWM